MDDVMEKPVIEYTEEGILFCDGLPCDMYYDCGLRCEICPVNGDQLLISKDSIYEAKGT